MSSPTPSSTPSLAPPPATPVTPPPSSPATPTAPTSSATPPPPTGAAAPPPAVNSPPPAAPPPAVPQSPPPPTSSPPPPAATPPAPALSSPPPPAAQPPTASPPPPLTPVVLPPPPSSPALPPPPPAVAVPPPAAPVTPSPPPRNSPTPPSPPPTTVTPPPRNSPTPPSPPPPTVTPPPRNSPTPPSPPPPTATPPPPGALPPRSPPSTSPPPPPLPSQSPPPPDPQPSPPADPLTPPSPGSPPPTASTSPPPSESPPISTQPPPSPTTPSLPNLTPPPSPPSPENPTNSSSEVVSAGSGGGLGSGGLVGISVVIGAGLICLIIGLIWLGRRRRRRVAGHNNGYVLPSPYLSSNFSDGSSFMKNPANGGPFVRKSSNSSGNPYSPPEPAGFGNSKSWFSYEELMHVTDGFSESNILGQGGFGPVYKGTLPDGTEVAVKQLKVGGNQGEREFRAEIEIISRIHHRHLVSLVGYCIHESQRLLVYDYVPNNTLDYHLHGQGRPVMDWATRVKIAAGAARGIAYLHEDCHPRVIHRDIKSSNILLDNNFDAQVSDFGLAKLASDTFTHVSTRVMGTFGYLAPEYALSGKLSEKSDVYSFGVVLLELVTGRKSVDTSQPLGEESLVEWARPLLSQVVETRNIEALVDPKLEENYVDSEIFRMIEAAAACVRHSAVKRPRMGQIVRALDSIADSFDLINGLTPGESTMFDVESAEIRLFQRMAFGSQEFRSDFSQTSWRGDSKEV